MNSIKGKLESTHGEQVGAGSSEKRACGDLQKQRRKVEGELKMAQEAVSELETIKVQLQGIISRKEKDISVANSNLDDHV